MNSPWNLKQRDLGQTETWWQAWRAGMIDVNATVKSLVVHRLEDECTKPGPDNGAWYHQPDLDKLLKTGKCENPMPSTHDLVAACTQALGLLPVDDRLAAIYEALGMQR